MGKILTNVNIRTNEVNKDQGYFNNEGFSRINPIILEENNNYLLGDLSYLEFGKLYQRTLALRM